MGAPSRSTTPNRFGLMAAEAATVGAGGDSVRVGLNRLRAATDAYPPGAVGAVSAAAGAGRRRPPLASLGHRHRTRQLAHDVDRAAGGNREHERVQYDQSLRHHVFDLPGRMNPDTVSVASNSFGWLTFTTLTRRS